MVGDVGTSAPPPLVTCAKRHLRGAMSQSCATCQKAVGYDNLTLMQCHGAFFDLHTNIVCFEKILKSCRGKVRSYLGQSKKKLDKTDNMNINIKLNIQKVGNLQCES